MLKDSSRARLEIVELLRGVAAMSVAWFHFTNGGGFLRPENWLRQSGSLGYLGVEAFFVISGFIIPYSMLRGGFVLSKHFGTFMLKRVLRLDPPYLVAVALALVLWEFSAAIPGFRGSAPQVSVMQLLSHVGYLNALVGYAWLNPVFWSLAIEFQFYVCCALLFPLLVHSSPWLRFFTLIGICGSAFASGDEALVFHYTGLFALGILTFWRVMGLMSLRRYVLLLGLVATVAVANLGVPIAATGLGTALVISFVRVRRYRLPAFLGSISYSLYLMHVPIGGRIMNLAERLMGSPANAPVQVGVLAAAVVASLLAAYLMHRLVERPAQRWASAFGYSPRTSSVVADVERDGAGPGDSTPVTLAAKPEES